MEFYLGENDAGQKFTLSDHGTIFDGEFNLYDQSGTVARLEKMYTDYVCFRFHYSIDDKNILYNGLIYDLDKFIKDKLGVNLTEEFLDYRSSKMVMDKLTE